jgi:ornithine carbamoyltransferase
LQGVERGEKRLGAEKEKRENLNFSVWEENAKHAIERLAKAKQRKKHTQRTKRFFGVVFEKKCWRTRVRKQQRLSCENLQASKKI